jgi:hypothetical protein
MIFKTVLFQMSENGPWHAGVQMALTGENKGAKKAEQSIITELGIIEGPFHTIKSTEHVYSMANFTDTLKTAKSYANR